MNRRIVVTAGCGTEETLLGGTCQAHESHVDFDGFTVNWHVQQLEHGRRMWRDGPALRPNICHG